MVGHLQAEQIGRPSLPLFSRTSPISGDQHLLTNFFSYKMDGKDNNAMQRVFQVHILQGEKTETFSENRPQNEMPLVSPTGKDSPTGGPRQRSDEHERQLYHCPVTAFSTSALRNSWTYQQSVSPGLTPTVTRKWCPLVCNELMKHPWKCTVCTVHCTRHTIACD